MAANASHSVAAVVLAAGMSRRMGRPKLLLPFGEKPLLARVVENLLSVSDISPIVVVTGHNAQEIREAVREYTVNTAHNPDYAAGGMLSSVQTGVRALPADGGAFLLALGDQPMVRPDTLRALLSVWRDTGAPIVRPVYDGKHGHPILFSARCGPEILALPAEATLKDAVVRHAADIRDVVVMDPAILADIDTPEDYARALQMWNAIISSPVDRLSSCL
jgi:molybdenum cofactor cytidylyltransferase